MRRALIAYARNSYYLREASEQKVQRESWQRRTAAKASALDRLFGAHGFKMESRRELGNGEVYTRLCADLGSLLQCSTHIALNFGLMLEARDLLLADVKMRLTDRKSVV